jgi:hypothetical protein
MNNINWTQSILTAIITLVISVGGGMILFNLQFQKPELTYKPEKILPFNSQTQNLSIYHIKFENQGNKLAEEIVGEIELNPAKIKDVNFVSDYPIDLKLSNDSLKIKFSTPSLNPKESFKLSILATSNQSFPDTPIVKLRAKGIVGDKIEEDTNGKKELPFEKYLILIASSVTLISLLTRSLIKSQGIGEKHSDDQEKVIAFLCGIHNLDKQVDRLLSLPNKASYWSEADRLTAIAINSNTKDNLEKVRDVLTDLLEYAKISDSSKGIIYYNIARLEKHLLNETASNEFLEKAKKEIPKLLETRMKLDPVFKQKK